MTNDVTSQWYQNNASLATWSLYRPQLLSFQIEISQIHKMPHICNLCGLKCKDRFALSTHKRLKHGVHFCKCCGKPYRTKEGLENHIAVSTGCGLFYSCLDPPTTGDPALDDLPQGMFLRNLYIYFPYTSSP